MLATAALERLDDAGELSLMRRLALYPRLLKLPPWPTSRTVSPSTYMIWLANFTPSEMRKCAPHLRFIIQNDPLMTMTRLALVQGVVTVLASGLSLLGVGHPIRCVDLARFRSSQAT